MDIKDKVAFLRQSATYPDHPDEVEVVETHMSWVFLTTRWAYKMKKPVRYDFLDFTTLELRHHDCEEELRLNRRLGGDVYQGIIPLTIKADGQLELNGKGEPVEWLVKMIRLPRERMLDRMIARHQVREADVKQFSSVLAAFYRQATPVTMSCKAYRQQFEDSVCAYHEQLARPEFGLASDEIEAVSDGLHTFLLRQSTLLDKRVVDGRIIEAHGDLRPEHICLIDPPVFIDCLEFNRSFRLLDPIDELAFLAMECEHSGAAFIGDLVFSTYSAISGDRPESSLVNFYKAFRAQLRAKLAISHLLDLPGDSHQKWIGQTRSYLALARDYLTRLT